MAGAHPPASPPLPAHVALTACVLAPLRAPAYGASTVPPGPPARGCCRPVWRRKAIQTKRSAAPRCLCAAAARAALSHALQAARPAVRRGD